MNPKAVISLVVVGSIIFGVGGSAAPFVIPITEFERNLGRAAKAIAVMWIQDEIPMAGETSVVESACGTFQGISSNSHSLTTYHVRSGNRLYHIKVLSRLRTFIYVDLEVGTPLCVTQIRSRDFLKVNEEVRITPFEIDPVE